MAGATLRDCCHRRLNRRLTGLPQDEPTNPDDALARQIVDELDLTDVHNATPPQRRIAIDDAYARLRAEIPRRVQGVTTGES